MRLFLGSHILDREERQGFVAFRGLEYLILQNFPLRCNNLLNNKKFNPKSKRLNFLMYYLPCFL